MKQSVTTTTTTAALLWLLLLSRWCPSVVGFTVARPAVISNTALRHSTTASSVCMLDASLVVTLNKPSKTLAVILDVVPPNDDSNDNVNDILSMQLRKAKASALVTSDVSVAAMLVQEQATAAGNFPGPCPVLYSGDEIDQARAVGVSAVVVDADNLPAVNENVIVRLSSESSISDDLAQYRAFWIDVTKSSNDDDDDVVAQIQAIAQGLPADAALVVASLASMQDDNAELTAARELAAGGRVVNAVALQHAVVGDAEDLEYANFVVDGITKKKSSTFNMSGLTGSTNGHFGGVASTQARTWLRMQRRKTE